MKPMRTSLIQVAFGLVGWAGLQTAAADCTTQLAGRAGGPCQAAASVTGKSYIAIGSKFMVVSTSNPALPAVQGTLALPDAEIHDIVMMGQFAVVAGGPSLFVVDVSNPAAPALVGTLAIGSTTEAIAISGTNAFVATWNGLHVVSLANPAAPTQTGFLASEPMRGVAVSGSTAFVTVDDVGLRSINIATPAAPTLIATYGVSHPVRDVKIQGSNAFVANGYLGLLVVNVSNPASMIGIGTLDTGDFAQDLQLDGNRAYMASGLDGLLIVNISNPAAPTLVGQHNTPESARAIALSGTVATVADYTSVRFVNTANQASPTLYNSMIAGAATGAVALNGNYAYAASWSGGFQVVNTADLENPAIIGQVSPQAQTQAFDGVAVGGYLYTADNYQDRFSIYSLANPAAPALLSSIQVPWVDEMAVSGNYVYMIRDEDNGFTGIRVLNVTNRAAPTIGVSLATPGTPTKSVAAAGHLYIAAQGGGVQIASLVNPASPALVNALSFGGNFSPICITAAGNRLYVGGWQAVHIYSLATPASPQYLGTYPLPGRTAHCLHAVGGRLFVGKYQGGIDIADVTNPAAPVQIDEITTPGTETVRMIQSRPGALVVANESAGVLTIASNAAADLDVDGDVDLGDLAALLGNYGMFSGAEPADGDLDDDGDVDLSDLSGMLSQFGSTCP